MSRSAATIIACCLSLFSSAAVCAADVTPLIENLQRLRVRHGVPALAFTLVRGNEVLHAGSHGTADLATKRAADRHTRFRIGSITKTFTALALMIAAEEGALALSNRFGELADETLIDNPWRETTPIRIEHLLEHSAGLTDLTREEMYHSDPRPLALAEAIEGFRANRVVRWQPGEYYSYSNAGAGLAAYALERATGVHYENFVQEKIFDALGMTTASVLLDEQTAATLAVGYDTDRQTPLPYWHMVFRPFGAVNLTAQDMAPFISLLLNRGAHGGRQLLGEPMMRRMERSETTLAARHGLSFGYGLGIYSWYHHGLLFHGHGGDGDGYLAHFGYSHAANMGYCIIINAFAHRPLAAMRGVIEDFIAASSTAIPPAVPGVFPGKPVLPATGSYAAATTRFGNKPDPNKTAMRLVSENGQLIFRTPNKPDKYLFPVISGLWREAGDATATIAIVRNAQGRWVFHGMRETFVHLPTPPIR